ncbi:MAG TPA: aldo/keto reductase [Bellilinea sp.]|nr:aldo/keto reductase [Bellilinea sp.]
MGKAGLKVSELSLGAWVTYGGQVGQDTAEECMKAAYEAGVNFFDNAEAYAHGNAEIVMGKAIKNLGWNRDDIVVSTKLFWGGDGPNKKGLSHKHLLEGINASLKRLDMEYVDLLFCHRPDPETPLEETVRAMDIIIKQGKAFYWGTSEWSAGDIVRADAIARQYNLTPPSMEQPEYSMLHRHRFEIEYEPVFRQLGYGTTIWSPLASGVLTGKYAKGVPEGSRGSLKNMQWILREDRIKRANKIKPIADDLACTMAQLALAWCLKNPNVSTVITGASKVEQVHENMKALKVVPKLTKEVMERIEAALDNKPGLEVN